MQLKPLDWPHRSCDRTQMINLILFVPQSHKSLSHMRKPSGSAVNGSEKRNSILFSIQPRMPRPQTIQIFLPAGDPRGMRVAEITTRIVRVIEVPRSKMGEFLKTPEAQQVGLYFLIGELSEAGLPRVYIGQSGNCGARLVQHNQNKDFWNRALVVISLTNSMTQTHALFLEWFAISEASKAERYSLENGNTGARPPRPRRWRRTAGKFSRPRPPSWPRWASRSLSR